MDQSACESCVLVGPNFFRSAEGGPSCIECPARQIASADFSSCFCKPGTFNVEAFGSVKCGDEGSAVEADIACVECPICLECDVAGNATILKPSWAFYGAGNAHRCPVAAGCIGRALFPKAVAAQRWAPKADGFFQAASLDDQCGEGYAGIICGECQPEYHHLRVGRPCDSCQDGVLNLPLVIGMVFGALIVGAVFITGMINTLSDHGVITDLRLMIGFYQLLAQMNNILNVKFPSPVPDILDFMKLMFLDVRNLIRLDCCKCSTFRNQHAVGFGAHYIPSPPADDICCAGDVGGFYGKLATNVFVMPLLFVVGCAVLFLNQRRTIAAVIAAGGSDKSAYNTATVAFKSNLLFGVFLLYPVSIETAHCPTVRLASVCWCCIQISVAAISHG